MQTTLIHIAFWVLVQLVPLVVVWVTYKITPDQKITANGPLGGLSFKAVGAMAAWILTVTFMTNNTDSVYSVLAEESQSKLKKWTIEGQIILVDNEGRHISGHNMIDSDKVVLTMRPASRVIGADGKLELKVAGEDMPNLDVFFISYGEDSSGRPLAYGQVDLKSLTTTETGEKLRKLHGLVEETTEGFTLRLPSAIVLRETSRTQQQNAFNTPYAPAVLTSANVPDADGGQ